MNKVILSVIASVAFGTVITVLSINAADVPHELTTFSGTYTPTKVSGPVVYYETPDIHPVIATAHTERHTYMGNGSENLPCPHGIRWIENSNLLTVLNCLLGTTTTEVLGPVFAYETPDGDHTEWHIHPPTTMQSAERPGAEAGELLLAAAAFGVMLAVLVVSVGYVTRKGR